MTEETCFRRILALVGACTLVACATNGPPPSTRTDGGPPDAVMDTMGDLGMGCVSSMCPAAQSCVAGACAVVPEDADRDGLSALLDCDDMDATVGRMAQRACPGDCGDGLERCVDGVWDTCDAPSDCDCTGSASRNIECDMCGLQGQGCVGGMWESVGVCTRQGPCSPGAVELGAPCGRCGTRQRTCTDTCSWSDFTCVEDATRCNYWVLAPGASAWAGYWLTDDSPRAPSTPIRAAIPVEGTGEAWVFTDTTYHVLSTSCVPRAVEPCWVRSGLMSELFGADVPAETLLFAVDIPPRFRGDDILGIDLGTTTTDYRFEMDTATGDIVHIATAPMVPSTAPEAPARSELRATFSNVGNAEGWVTAVCGDPAAAPTDYIGNVSGSRVHVFNPVAGCGFHHSDAFGEFPAFAISGAPNVGQVAAAFHEGGLFVLAE